MKLSLAILLVALITGAFGLNAVATNVPYNGTFSITILPGEYHYLPLYVVGEGRLSTRGRAAITAVSGARREVSGVVALHTGETVEAIEGALTVELPDGSVVEGRPRYKASDPTRVTVRSTSPMALLSATWDCSGWNATSAAVRSAQSGGK